MRSLRPISLLPPVLFALGCADDQPPTGPAIGGTVFSHVVGHLVVNSNSDAVDATGCDAIHCSLREAIADSSSDEITFSAGLSGPITLDTMLTIGRNLTITGPEDGLTVRRAPDDQNEFRIFWVNRGVTVRLTNLTVSGGKATGNGGGIMNEGDLTLTNCTVAGNRSDLGGGGIANSGFAGTLTLINSRVSGNEAVGFSARNGGGGILNFNTMTLAHSTVSGNVATWVGGGIANARTLTLTSSIVSGNSVTSASHDSRAGGIYNHPRATLTLTNTTVTGNTLSAGSGGGITNLGALTLTNSTVSGNSARLGHAGGIHSEGGDRSFGGTITLTNTLVALNTADLWPDIAARGPITAHHSLIGDGGGSGLEGQHGLNGNLVGTSAAPIDPKLRALALNVPGVTQTHALYPESPALDAGDNTVCADGSTVNHQDQRGITRPQGRACDVGSYEAQPGDLIDALQTTVTSLDLPSGISRSLISKLKDALRLVNVGEEQAACDKLQDFMNEVGALTGNKISPADASSLVAAATGTRRVLRC